jgi:hypothetical protein
VKKSKQTILVISDFHAPYSHPDAVAFLRACKRKFRPSTVVCIGDEIDGHAISFHEHNPDLPSAGEELKQAIGQLKKLYRLFPKCTVVESNHGSLVLRKAVAHGLPKAVLRSYNEILQAPRGWKWVDDVTVQTPLGPVYFCHGKSPTPGKLASLYGCSTVQGHYHERSQIHYISTPERLMFDLHTGCLADDHSLALQYNKINPKRPIVSIAIIVDGIPQLIPMVLTKSGRWNGKI